ncbi:MmgE/PrpD family protein [Falsiroseomonas oryziterrae]|uniref:MmgE/PrpD family protein n=1 Tax=Falsiroseomonas oryziterrae TaxID=2911368 RepID=UPI001F17F504|nr:MmgE/PrpD family protein [Roseomonas sp. NPKOSM-4]
MSSASKTEYGVANLGLGVSKALATFIAGLRFEDLPAPVVHEARRGVLDWIGCALAAAHHPTIAILLDTYDAIGSAPVARVLGHPGRRLGLLDAPVVNGQMGHLLDFDDTHMGGVVLHTSSPLLAALLALAEHRPVSGRDLIVAYVGGFEAGVRAGQGAPAHHDGGWHLTGTLGAIAAGAGSARLLGLDAKATNHAIGIATTQAAGMQQNRGTMCKSFHAGKAAASGALAALLAARGFNSSEEILEGKRGFTRIYSATATPDRITDSLGERFEIARNGYKPYACGVVLHPLIDAMIALSRSAALPADAVDHVELRVHPHAVKITGVDDPRSGLMSKFSINHSASVAYLDGAAGIAQYADARATAPDVLAFRPKVRVVVDEGFRKDQAHAVLFATDGRRFEAPVAHASGTVDNPMSDRAIEDKFLGNAAPVLGDARARQVAERSWSLDAMPDVRDLVALCA